MRTTIELPDELLKRAKIAAVERGVSLKDLVREALAKDLSAAATPAPRRVKFPIFPSKRPGSLHLTNADIARLEEEEDIRRHGLPR